MIHKLKKQFCFILAAVCVISALCVCAAAAGNTVDFERQGSLSVTLTDKATGEAVGGSYTLYKVADVTAENGNLSYTFTADFASCGISLDDISAENLAEHLAAYAADRGIAGTSAVGDKNGKVKFEGLGLGLYLLVQTKASDGYYNAAPFVVSVPMSGDNEWIYDVDASPKTETRPAEPELKDLKVTKVWQDNKTSHEAVTVELLCDGAVKETVKLASSNNWEYTWKSLDQSHVWSVIEKNVPDGYKANYSATGGTTTITNRADDYTPPKGGDKLIQTGQLNWPVPVLAAAGLLLFAAGWIIINSKGKKNRG